MIGMILGNRYEILKEVGSGGMANVYLAQCRLLNRHVAVKILKNEFANDKEFLERFNKEAQAAAAISSPNIVNVYDVGHDGDIHYIVMEYVEGQTLKEYIDENGMLSWQETVEYAIQICSALDKAHKNGIIHRDIKPQNIILTNDGVLKVTDFGIARASSNETKNMGESTMGSVHYFSPEQARGGYTDAKSDIYSLGIVMYELITGILPFNGESPIAIAIKHMQEKPISPKEFNISIPLAVESIILKAMSKEQHLRYQSAEEMLADLNHVMHTSGEAVLNIPVSDGNTIKMDPVQEIPVNTPPKEEQSPRRPVHNDKKQGKNNKKEKTNGTKIAVILAIVSAFVVLLFAAGIIGCAFTGGCSTSKELTVPVLTGMTYEEAVEQYGEEFDIIEYKEIEDEATPGTIVDQDPAGERKTKNKEIRVTVSKGIQGFVMQDFEGRTIDYLTGKLQNEIDEHGIKIDVIEEQNPDVEKDKIIKTVPAAGEAVKKNTTIKVYISAAGVEMPKLVEYKLSDAKKILEENGLELGNVTPTTYKDDYVVIGQSVDPGKNVAKGTKIDLELRAVGESSGSSNSNSKTITILIPQSSDSTVVRVEQDGEVIHNRRHDKSEGSTDVRVTGSGTVKVDIYFDGQLEDSLTVKL